MASTMLSGGPLTPGAIRAVVYSSEGSKVDGYHPTLQVINIKPVQNGNDRFRIILSDGAHYVQGMLATQINHLIHEKKLVPNSVIRLEAFMKNSVGGKPVIIVLNLTVLDSHSHAHSHAGGRIGNPVEYQPPPVSAAAHHPLGASAAASAQPLYNSTNGGATTTNSTMMHPSNVGSSGLAATSSSSGMMMGPSGAKGGYGGGGGMGSPSSSSNPYASSAHRPGSSGSSGGGPIVRDPGAHHAITHISNLNMYNNRWTIKARVTSKSDIRSWSNAKGEGTLFSVELLDAAGMDIRATFFKEAVDKFHPLLHVGKVYRMSGGKLKVANMQWNTCKSQYEITFDQNAEIHLENDAGDISAQSYTFVKLSQLESLPEKQHVDVLAIVKSVGEPVNLISKKSGQELTKCDCTLVDDSGVEVTLTMWGDKAKKMASDLGGTPVVAFRRARVSDYGGKTLSGGDGVDVNPNISEATTLRTWWQTFGSSAATRSLSTIGSGGGKMDSFADRKSVGSIKEEGLGQGGGGMMAMGAGGGAGPKADWLSFKATIMFIKKDREGGSWYTACPNAGEPCKNRFKVTQTTGMQYYCEKCQQTYDKCVRRWIFTASLEDDTAATWVSIFNEQAEQMLLATADQVYEQTYEGGQDQDAYDSYFARANFTEWIFKCRVNNEMVNDEMRVKTTVHGMVPVDYAKESRDLLAEIAKF